MTGHREKKKLKRRDYISHQKDSFLPKFEKITKKANF